MTENELEDLLTVEEAARLLKVHQNTIRVRIRTGKLRAMKFGRQWRIPRRALLESLEPRSSGDDGED